MASKLRTSRALKWLSSAPVLPSTVSKSLPVVKDIAVSGRADSRHDVIRRRTVFIRLDDRKNSGSRGAAGFEQRPELNSREDVGTDGLIRATEGVDWII
jgi:hypothetical protein